MLRFCGYTFTINQQFFPITLLSGELQFKGMWFNNENNHVINISTGKRESIYTSPESTIRLCFNMRHRQIKTSRYYLCFSEACYKAKIWINDFIRVGSVNYTNSVFAPLVFNEEIIPTCETKNCIGKSTPVPRIPIIPHKISFKVNSIRKTLYQLKNKKSQ